MIYAIWDIIASRKHCNWITQEFDRLDHNYWHCHGRFNLKHLQNVIQLKKCLQIYGYWHALFMRGVCCALYVYNVGKDIILTHGHCSPNKMFINSHFVVLKSIFPRLDCVLDLFKIWLLRVNSLGCCCTSDCKPVRTKTKWIPVEASRPKSKFKLEEAAQAAEQQTGTDIMNHTTRLSE